MIRPVTLAFFCSVAVAAMVTLAHAYPKPSPYPVSWQLKFQHDLPRRIVVTPPGSNLAQAYWYLRYSVTNLSRDQQKFLPVFDLMTEDGRVIRSDLDVPTAVLREIRIRERNPNLLPVNEIAGPIRVGVDQARDGVAIWKEPDPEMGRFKIFVTGLSGEAVIVKDSKGEPMEKTGPDGKKEPVVLWKTLEMNFLMLGDELRPGIDPLKQTGETWVMR